MVMMMMMEGDKDKMFNVPNNDLILFCIIKIRFIEIFILKTNIYGVSG